MIIFLWLTGLQRELLSDVFLDFCKRSLVLEAAIRFINYVGFSHLTTKETGQALGPSSGFITS